jgi:hypothetical protein
MLWVAFASVLITAAVGLGISLWIRWLWRKTGAPKWTLVVAVTLALLPLAGGLLGMSMGVLSSIGATAGPMVDPSHKARILAGGISEALKCTALGLVTALVMTLPILIVLSHRYRSSGAKRT